MATISIPSGNVSMVPWLYALHPADCKSIGITQASIPLVFARPRKIPLTVTFWEQAKQMKTWFFGKKGSFASCWFFLQYDPDETQYRSFAFPAASINKAILSGSGEGWSTTGMATIQKFTDVIHRDPIVIPQFNAAGGGSSENFSIGAEFTIFNTDYDGENVTVQTVTSSNSSYMQNKMYLQNLLNSNVQSTMSGRNKSGSTTYSNINRIDPPCLYEVLIPGLVWAPACKMSFTAEPIGIVRTMKNGDLVPDAWKINLEFTCLVPMKKDYFKIGSKSNLYTASTTNIGSASLADAPAELRADITNLGIERTTKSGGIASPAKNYTTPKATKILSDGTVCYVTGDNNQIVKESVPGVSVKFYNMTNASINEEVVNSPSHEVSSDAAQGATV